MKTEIKIMNKQQRQKYSAKHIRRMKLFKRKHLRPVFIALQTQITPVARTLREKGFEAAINSLDSVVINQHLAPVIQEIYKDVGVYFANKTIHDLRQSAKEQKAGFGFNAEFIRDILNFFARFLLTEAVLPISETMKNIILAELTEGIEQGKGAEEIARQIESKEFTLIRARLVTRTEANKAMNYGQQLGEAKSPWESLKIWIDAKDDRERASHVKVGGEILDFKERYSVPVYKSVGGIRGVRKGIQMQVGIDYMSGPGDVHASAGNICNCRCTLAFIAKRDENGRLIRKPEGQIQRDIERINLAYGK